MSQDFLQIFIDNYRIKLKETYRLLEKCTIIIQKTWRGYLGRKYYRRKLSEVVIECRHNKFSRAAAKIQSAWKGYLTRKYVFNFYSLRQELIKDEKSMNTKKKKKKKKTKTNDIENKTKSSIEQKSELSSYQSNKVINDLPKKIKGPFKPPDEVKKWMNTPLNLSLRVSTDYFSLEKAQQSWKSEEWNNRLHDNYFYTGQPSSLPYEGLLWTKSVYGSIPYGTKHFRMSEDENHSIQPRFRNVLPPIALFDRFNKEYIPGYATG
ncbi:Spermatogenesis-associated protein 17 [Schistosoma japonicum]|nr:Spermatogenesis-associated protein 17 [Schistosoma japonicum]KAH8869209.1 Spermatogenesis-associated protein 17 [Schistosoma japonicum]KAH8869210.1 Spermatogenesis-associated protein 17 [Schistosoma japonicum]